MKVTLEDFQILQGRHEFEFPVGITVMTGPNASGKSTVFYAIQNALRNPSGVADCINHNANKASVTIDSNDSSVTWIRTKSSSVYRDNLTNAEYVNASKLDSRDIADLGFYYNINSDVVNIHDEWSVLFPFGESDTQMFRLFEDIFNISCSFQVIDEMKKDEQNLKSEINRAETDINSLQKRQNSLLEITTKLNVADVENRINNIQKSSQLVSELREDYSLLSANKLVSTVILPNVFDINLLYDSTYRLRELQQDYESYLALNSKCGDVPNFEFKEHTFNTEVFEISEDYRNYSNCVREIAECLATLSECESTISEIQSKISKISVCPTCGRPLEE